MELRYRPAQEGVCRASAHKQCLTAAGGAVSNDDTGVFRALGAVQGYKQPWSGCISYDFIYRGRLGTSPAAIIP